jgi:hypothetical protein
MDASCPISRGGMRSRKPTGSSALIAGTEKLWNRAVSWRGKTVARSWLSTSPGCASPCMLKEERLFGKVTAQAKGAVSPPAKYTTSRSRPQKPTPPNARWQLSASRLGSSSTARTKTKRVSSDNRPRCSQPLQVHHPSRVSAYTLTIQHPSRGPRTITGGGTTAP